MPNPPHRPAPTGRFAPSPTGDLHFGSLLAALASRANALAAGGRWLVRIENIDPPREVEGSANRILSDLEALGMPPGRVLYQSTRTPAYRAAIEQLLDQGLAFWCGCSRADLPPDGVYRGTCRNGIPAGRRPRAVRLRVNDRPVSFRDEIQGTIVENLDAGCGDFVVWRADGLPAYQLAVVVDDAHQGVTEVVRGADLLDSTARQVYLQRCLGLPTPKYAHHPVAMGADGRKLSKRLRSDPVSSLRPAHSLGAALRFLGQPCPDGLDLRQTWAWALAHWDLSRIPRARELPLLPETAQAR